MANVRLTVDELERAARIGVARAAHAIANNLKGQSQQKPQNFIPDHIQGAVGEYAVAKFFEIAWDGTIGRLDSWQEHGKTRPIDVGPFEVKSRKYAKADLLISVDNVHDWQTNGAPKMPIILVTGYHLDWTLAGWAYGDDVLSHGDWFEPVPGRWSYRLLRGNLYQNWEDLREMAIAWNERQIATLKR